MHPDIPHNLVKETVEVVQSTKPSKLKECMSFSSFLLKDIKND